MWDYLLIFLVVAAVMFAGVFYFRTRTRREMKSTENAQESINLRPLAEVRPLVDALLTETEWEVQMALIEEMRFGPISNSFFSPYKSVSHEPFPSLELQLPDSTDSPTSGFLLIGMSMESLQVDFNTSTDAVVEFERGEQIEDGMLFTSVYHYLLFKSSLNDDPD